MMHSRYKNAFLKFSVLVSLCGFAGSSYAQYPGFDAPSARSSAGNASGLVAVESKVNGGAIPVGATAQVVVLFRNEGAQPVSTGQINLYPSSTVTAQVSLNQCQSEPLQSGAECAIAVSVKGMQAGPYRLDLLMLHSGRSRLVTATVSGSIDSSGEASDKLSNDIEAVPDEIDFGGLSASQVMTESIVLRNITSNPLTMSEVGIKSGKSSGFDLEHDCNVLSPGQACVATVTWAPRQKGPATGALILKHDGPGRLSRVGITGDYEPDEVEEAEVFPDAVPGYGLMVSSQEEIDFGSGVKSASTVTVSLVNTGDSPLVIKGIKVSGSDNGLSLASSGCATGIELQPIEACPLTITWSPTRTGEVFDDVQILHTGVRGVLVLPVRGESEGAVSQDQQAILLTDLEPVENGLLDGNDIVSQREGTVSVDRSAREMPRSAANRLSISNARSTLDGLKITSFAKTRAIVNGPSGSRLLHDGEQVMLGGVNWNVHIQENGIEFETGGERVLLLFDRSLSAVKRVSTASNSSSSSSSASSSSDN